jgi:hypothetical protein
MSAIFKTGFWNIKCRKLTSNQRKYKVSGYLEIILKITPTPQLGL